jgi:hypothetical protein
MSILGINCSDNYVHDLERARGGGTRKGKGEDKGEWKQRPFPEKGTLD